MGQCNVLLLRMQAVVQILAPLAGPRVAEAVRKTVNEMFGVYTHALAAGFAKYTKPDGTLPPRLGEPLFFASLMSKSPLAYSTSLFVSCFTEVCTSVLISTRPLASLMASFVSCFLELCTSVLGFWVLVLHAVVTEPQSIHTCTWLVFYRGEGNGLRWGINMF